MKLSKNLNKGFTLIELLVVIAIIGLLSSVVLASLSTARNRSKITAVKSSMAQLRSQMELVRSDATGYGVNTGTTGCTGGGAFSDSVVATIIADITSEGATNGTCTTDGALSVNDTKWAYSVTLPASGGSWCIDSSGAVSATTDTNTPNPIDGDCGN